MLLAPTSLPVIWSAPEPATPLSPGEVHLWRATSDVPAERLHKLRAHLSPSETARAARFRREKDCHRWIAARGTLRELLGRLRMMPPSEVPIEVTAEGKPFIPFPPGQQAVQFNLSHAGDWVLYATALDRAVGVDLECESRVLDHLDLALHFFTPAEYSHLQQVSVALQKEHFYRLWTAKEACLKALGLGLRMAPDQVELGFAAHNTLKLLHLPGAGSGACLMNTTWMLQELDVQAGYWASLAMPGPLPRLHFWDLDLAGDLPLH